MIRIGLYAVNGAHAYTGGVVVVAYALGAFCGVYLVNFSAHVNSFVWALGITHVAVNAFAVYK